MVIRSYRMTSGRRCGGRIIPSLAISCLLQSRGDRYDSGPIWRDRYQGICKYKEAVS